jgi:hypothetical protein
MGASDRTLLTMAKTEEELKEAGQEILRSLSAEEQALLNRVIDSERERIHMGTPTGIYDEIRKAIDEVIRD